MSHINTHMNMRNRPVKTEPRKNEYYLFFFYFNIVYSTLNASNVLDTENKENKDINWLFKKHF